MKLEDKRSVVAIYRHPDAWMDACRAVRARGVKGVEGWAPYPVHGMDDALGIKRSLIGRPVLAALLIGAVLGFAMQYWMMKVDWPLIIGGKPFNSWPQYVVITFEAGILCGALTNFMLALGTSNLRPRLHNQLWRDDLGDDAFAVAIPLLSANPGEAELRQMLASTQAEEIEIYDTSADTIADLSRAERQQPIVAAPQGEQNHG